MGSTLLPSASVASTQTSPKESKASMSITNMLNGAPSQLPTPDVSPNQPAINDLSRMPSATETLTSSTPARDRDYLLLSPSQTELSPPLFQGPPSRSHSRLTSQSRNSLQQSPSRSSTVELSNSDARVRDPSLPLENPMSDQMFRLVSLGPENPNDPDGPREAVLQSQAWTNAANHPRQYRDMLYRTNRATYASMEAPALNMLADLSVAQLEPRPRLSTRSKAQNQRRRLGQDLCEPPSAPSRTASSRQTRGKRRGSEDATEATPPKRQRSEAQKKKKFQSFTEIVDYCPDIKTEGLKKPFEIEQKPNRIDLSNEPQDLRDRMTDTELNMASNLRLNCNNFLINKRLIFQGKVDHIIRNASFSKTHAQHFGVIDVNKSSQMFSYFTAAGWMEDSILSPFVTREKALRKQLELEQGDAVDVRID